MARKSLIRLGLVALGYLSPALAMLLGAALGNLIEQGSDAARALGAIVGFLAALVLARLLIAPLPELRPRRMMPQAIPLSRHVTPFPKEPYHD